MLSSWRLPLSPVGSGSMSKVTAGLLGCPPLPLRQSPHGNSRSEQAGEADSSTTHSHSLSRVPTHHSLWAPILKSGLCVRKTGTCSRVRSRRSLWGHSPAAQLSLFPPSHLEALWLSPGIFPLITYQTTKKTYYRKLCNRKSFCRIHNSKSHFPPPCTSSVQLALIWESFQRKYVCGSKISRFLVNCQKAFFPLLLHCQGKNFQKNGGWGQRDRSGEGGGRIKGGGEETFCLSLFVWYLDQFFWEGISVSVGWVAEAGAFYPSSMNKEVLSSQWWERSQWNMCHN